MRVYESTVDQIADAFKALADPTRVRIIHLLATCGELCVCDVEAILSISQSRASRHLGHLRRVGIVADRRDRTWIYYRVARPAHPVLRDALRELRRALAADPQAVADLEAQATYVRGSECTPLTLAAAHKARQ